MSSLLRPGSHDRRQANRGSLGFSHQEGELPMTECSIPDPSPSAAGAALPWLWQCAACAAWAADDPPLGMGYLVVLAVRAVGGGA
jgi:hypothetical protein